MSLTMKLAIRITGGVLIVIALFFAPIIPINVALKTGLPEIVASPEITNEDASAITLAARGGKLVSISELVAGIVNQPFTYIQSIGSGDMPYPGSIESQADIIIGYGWYSDSMSGGGYKVYLKKANNSWVVIKRSEYLI